MELLKSNLSSIVVIICSPAIYNGEKDDRAGQAILQELAKMGAHDINYLKIKGGALEIRSLISQSDSKVMIFSGGTSKKSGFSTTNTLTELIDEPLEELTQKIVAHGLSKSPLAARSRPIAGMRNKKLLLAISGSTNGALDAIEAIKDELWG